MIVYHWTLATNLDTIRQHGLLPDLATGAKPLVWLVVGQMRWWAQQHVAASHQWRKRDLVCLKLVVPDAWLTKRWCGVYVCKETIPADMLVEHAAAV